MITSTTGKEATPPKLHLSGPRHLASPPLHIHTSQSLTFMPQPLSLSHSCPSGPSHSASHSHAPQDPAIQPIDSPPTHTHLWAGQEYKVECLHQSGCKPEVLLLMQDECELREHLLRAQVATQPADD